MYKELADKQWLEAQYVERRRTLDDIGNEIGCSKHSVLRALKRLGIERRKHTSKYYLLNDKAWLEKAYVEDERTIKDIADEIGTTPGNVHAHLSTLGIRTRGAKETYEMMNPDGRHGEDAANWKGGRRIINGYVFVYAPDHPSAHGGVVQEHRLVMEKVIGRYLEPYEVVHHLDGDRLNNDPSNLELKTRGKHISEHFKASHEVLHLRQEVADLKAELERLKQGT
jgi:hypothetical protein